MPKSNDPIQWLGTKMTLRSKRGKRKWLRRKLKEELREDEYSS